MPITPLSTLSIAMISFIMAWQINYNTKEGRLKASYRGALPVL